MPHGADLLRCLERVRSAQNTEESTSCTLSIKIEPDTRGTSPGMTVNDCAATDLSGRVPHLQHTPANLILLDRLEQRLEITLAESIIALALDEFEENRPDRVRRKDLQQHLGVAAVDDALTVDQNAVALQADDVLAMLRQARVDLLEIGIGR